MRFSTFDTEQLSPASQKKSVSLLTKYREKIEKVVSERDSKKPEYTLVHPADPTLHDVLEEIGSAYKKTKHLVVVGIGGSSLGVEAVHTTLGEQGVRLSVIDTIAPYEIDILLEQLSKYRKVEQVTVCVVSKSGGTAETLVNAEVLLSHLKKQFGAAIWKQVIYIGNKGTDTANYFKRKKAKVIAMPEKVGGRFSVSTEVALVPLKILGHDTDAFMAGLLATNEPEFESLVAESAAYLHSYVKKSYEVLNIFVFDKRLYQVAAWYRQLFAESLGKEMTRYKKPLRMHMLPTITTPVELHSVGQLYFSGKKGVFTEFVTFEDDVHEHKITKGGVANAYSGRTNQEVLTAMYAGVVGAYQDRKLPYRSVIFDDLNLAYSLGLYMGLRMREVMYIAELLDLNAFNQPNVELYKKKTRKILNIN